MLSMFITSIFALLCAMWLLAGLIASIFIVGAMLLNKLKPAPDEGTSSLSDWPRAHSRGDKFYSSPIDYRDVA